MKIPISTPLDRGLDRQRRLWNQIKTCRICKISKILEEANDKRAPCVKKAWICLDRCEDCTNAYVDSLEEDMEAYYDLDDNDYEEYYHAVKEMKAYCTDKIKYLESKK